MEEATDNEIYTRKREHENEDQDEDEDEDHRQLLNWNGRLHYSKKSFIFNYEHSTVIGLIIGNRKLCCMTLPLKYVEWQLRCSQTGSMKRMRVCNIDYMHWTSWRKLSYIQLNNGDKRSKLLENSRILRISNTRKFDT